MSVPQFGDCSNRIESSVLAEGVGDDLEGLGEGLEAVCVGSCEGVGVQHQLPGDLGLRCPASSDQEPFLNQAPDNAEGVMERSK